MNTWVVRRWWYHSGGSGWNLLGIYTEEKDAVAACETASDLVGPVPLNQYLGGNIGWPGTYYPLAPSK